MEPPANQQQPVPPQPPVVNNAPPPKKSNTLLIIVVVIIIFLAVGLAAGYFLATSSKPVPEKISPVPQISPTAFATITTPLSPTITVSIITPTETPQSTQSALPTYKNTQYGFEISYPASYKVLTDSDNLYGWPNGIALLYKGGQTYDIAIQIWNTQAEYENQYPSAAGTITEKKTGNKIITIMDVSGDPDNAAVISSFKFTN